MRNSLVQNKWEHSAAVGGSNKTCSRQQRPVLLPLCLKGKTNLKTWFLECSCLGYVSWQVANKSMKWLLALPGCSPGERREPTVPWAGGVRGRLTLCPGGSSAGAEPRPCSRKSGDGSSSQGAVFRWSSGFLVCVNPSTAFGFLVVQLFGSGWVSCFRHLTRDWGARASEGFVSSAYDVTALLQCTYLGRGLLPISKEARLAGPSSALTKSKPRTNSSF